MTMFLSWFFCVCHLPSPCKNHLYFYRRRRFFFLSLHPRTNIARVCRADTLLTAAFIKTLRSLIVDPPCDNTAVHRVAWRRDAAIGYAVAVSRLFIIIITFVLLLLLLLLCVSVEQIAFSAHTHARNATF